MCVCVCAYLALTEEEIQVLQVVWHFSPVFLAPLDTGCRITGAINTIPSHPSVSHLGRDGLTQEQGERNGDVGVFEEL